ncbi:uncharacterized protein LOC110344819 isoform X2 [Heterocephalus glaber]|uniref:Uncharacterized protein LOC110344819 isoform X2 n=1 Tax=Heterocephalus glaber TaxID=10181 RepID=A0AAX6RDN0_HETGA|nr:uncharacterized protein LOC110344819 isoform X2 [Heterocephalus glaber]
MIIRESSGGIHSYLGQEVSFFFQETLISGHPGLPVLPAAVSRLLKAPVRRKPGPAPGSHRGWLFGSGCSCLPSRCSSPPRQKTEEREKSSRPPPRPSKYGRLSRAGTRAAQCAGSAVAPCPDRPLADSRAASPWASEDQRSYSLTRLRPGFGVGELGHLTMRGPRSPQDSCAEAISSRGHPPLGVGGGAPPPPPHRGCKTRGRSPGHISPVCAPSRFHCICSLSCCINASVFPLLDSIPGVQVRVPALTAAPGPGKPAPLPQKAGRALGLVEQSQPRKKSRRLEGATAQGPLWRPGGLRFPGPLPPAPSNGPPAHPRDSEFEASLGYLASCCLKKRGQVGGGHSDSDEAEGEGRATSPTAVPQKTETGSASLAWWCMPVIPALWKAEAGGWQVVDQPSTRGRERKKEKERKELHKHAFTQVHSSALHGSPEVAAAHLSIGKGSS